MPHLCFKLLFLTFYCIVSNAMMIRNDALISRMVSNFQKDNTANAEPTPRNIVENPNVLALMQNVLCKNFPSIPCDMIVEDDTLRKLIERSIQQLKYKKLTMEKTTSPPAYHLTLFPTINSEDLSNFLQESDTGYYSKGNQNAKRERRHKKRLGKVKTEEKDSTKVNTNQNDNQRPSVYPGRKKIRKFYPHKIKYKDKYETTPKDNFKDYSDERFSMSLENPEANVGRRLKSKYRSQPPNSPVWRIDYMKHGEPTLNLFDYEPERLNEKLVKTGPNVIVSDGLMEQNARKEVLHPDVYIKKNYIRKNALDLDSVGMD